MPDKKNKKQAEVKIDKTGAVINENGMSLASRWKSGILSLIFSRFTLIVVLFVVQAALMLMMWGMFGALLDRFATGASTAFVIVVLIFLINTDMDATAKITWMLIISIVPFFGVMFYIWTQAELGHRAIAATIEESTDLSRGKLAQDPRVLERLKATDRDSASVANYTIRAGNYPAYENTKVTYFPLGINKFEEMLVRLEKAKKFIFLEYFIIQEGYMWGKILEILARKVEEGVEVRVLFDGTNLLSKVPTDYQKRLTRLGIQCRVWAPLRPIVTSTYNYRDHRKILVIDGEVAFNGGVNLADEYIGRTHPFGEWKDTAVMLEGDAIKSFTDIDINDNDNPFSTYFPRNIPVPADARGFVIPYGDSPLDEYKVGEMVYIDMLNTAEDYIYIMTPYLILDGELESALRFAAERGVDVRLILPGIPDKKAVYALAKATVRPLLRSGVKVYTYTPGFVHAKVFVSDNRKAIVGTINLDYRSLYHHFECATYMVDTPCISDIYEDYMNTLKDCKPVTPESLKEEGLFQMILGATMKMIAPML